MNIWAFDLATKTGVAMGPPPDDLSRLNSQTVLLRNNKQEDNYDLSFNFDTYLYRATFKYTVFPDLMAFEAPVDINAKFRDGRQRSSEALLLPPLLVKSIRDVAAKYRVAWKLVWPATIRAKFIDRPSAGERISTKQAVLDRCKLWGYLPETCRDDNRADAVALWHVVQCERGWRPRFEIIMGKRVPVVRERAA